MEKQNKAIKKHSPKIRKANTPSLLISLQGLFFSLSVFFIVLPLYPSFASCPTFYRLIVVVHQAAVAMRCTSPPSPLTHHHHLFSFPVGVIKCVGKVSPDVSSQTKSPNTRCSTISTKITSKLQKDKPGIKCMNPGISKHFGVR